MSGNWPFHAQIAFWPRRVQPLLRQLRIYTNRYRQFQKINLSLSLLSVFDRREGTEQKEWFIFSGFANSSNEETQKALKAVCTNLMGFIIIVMAQYDLSCRPTLFLSLFSLSVKAYIRNRFIRRWLFAILIAARRSLDRHLFLYNIFSYSFPSWPFFSWQLMRLYVQCRWATRPEKR